MPVSLRLEYRTVDLGYVVEDFDGERLLSRTLYNEDYTPIRKWAQLEDGSFAESRPGFSEWLPQSIVSELPQCQIDRNIFPSIWRF